MIRETDTAPLRSRGRLLAPAGLAAVLVLVGACSAASTTDPPGAASGSTAPGSTAGAGDEADGGAPPCETPATEPVTAVAVPDVPGDLDLTSFDGTVIRIHWFPVGSASAAAPQPTVLMGPGWGLPGDTNVEAVGVLGALNISSLHRSGYNVLTWDPRGFGKSGGIAQVNSVDVEARDVQQLVSWLAAQPDAALDAPGDPTSGMVGGSYGGGIQLVTAAIDCRVDALVPVVAWHSLGTSLYKDQTFKAGWATILSGVSATATVDPHVKSANQSATATGVLSDEDEAWFLDRGPAELVGDITVPTLFVAGTVDTLFTLDEDITNYRMLRDNGVPTAMYWFCGGHGVCLTDPGDPARMQTAIISWLDRYVKNDESIDTGARFDLLDQDGIHYVADDYPTAEGEPITANGSGNLELVAGGGAGPTAIPEGNTDLLGRLVGPITPAPATNAVAVPIPAPAGSPRLVLGAPRLTLTYTGTIPAGERPTRAFAQLVDDETGLVLGNQITPIPLVLDGTAHELTLPLEVVAFTVKPGTSLTLQIVATTTAYGEPRLGGSVRFTEIDVALPTATGVRPA